MSSCMTENIVACSTIHNALLTQFFDRSFGFNVVRFWLTILNLKKPRTDLLTVIIVTVWPFTKNSKLD